MLDTIPPRYLAVMPDAPWSDRAGYWVDSAHDGGYAIATAIAEELVPGMRDDYDTAESTIAGYSMGGVGAVTLLLRYPELFSRAVALSPALYWPEPHHDSTSRGSGAFGLGSVLFDEDRYRELTALNAPHTPVRLFLGAGDAEPPITEAARAIHDRASRLPGVTSELAIVPGGHDVATWRALLRIAFA